VTFNPAAAGNVTGSIAVSSNAANSPTVITLSAAGVTQLAHFVLLSWMPSTVAVSGYNVYSSSLPGGPYTKLGSSPVTGTTYTDRTVLPGNTYYYVLTAVDSNNVESAFSNEVSATVPLSGGGVAQVAHSVHLSWTPSASAVTGYNAYSSAVPGGPYTKLAASPLSGTTFTDNNVASGKTYYYVMTAVDSNNVESLFSNEVSVTVP
jgi:fibronectin type 3 domain-containing protein